MLRQQLAHQLGVADVTLHQRDARHRLAEASAEIVEHHQRLAAAGELLYRVAADVTGAAGHQDCLCHELHLPSCPPIMQG